MSTPNGQYVWLIRIEFWLHQDNLSQPRHQLWYYNKHSNWRQPKTNFDNRYSNWGGYSLFWLSTSASVVEKLSAQYPPQFWLQYTSIYCFFGQVSIWLFGLDPRVMFRVQRSSASVQERLFYKVLLGTSVLCQWHLYLSVCSIHTLICTTLRSKVHERRVKEFDRSERASADCSRQLTWPCAYTHQSFDSREYKNRHLCQTLLHDFYLPKYLNSMLPMYLNSMFLHTSHVAEKSVCLTSFSMITIFSRDRYMIVQIITGGASFLYSSSKFANERCTEAQERYSTDIFRLRLTYAIPLPCEKLWFKVWNPICRL